MLPDVQYWISHFFFSRHNSTLSSSFFFLTRLFHVCRQNISSLDIKALIAFFETSHDMTCIEDVLHMVIRAVSQKPLLVSFLEQVNLIGGCHIFVNLLQRYAFCIKS